MILRVNHVNKQFMEPVLQDVCCTFESGKLYVIKGVSGCGKTTLLNILGGIDTEYEGTIEQDPSEKLSIGYVFQKSFLLTGLTAYENLCLIRNDPERIRQLAGELLIEDLLDHYPEKLSGGERQRFSVLRALLPDPQLILADEPTASLDGANSQKMAELLAGLKQEGRIVIVATHEDCFDCLADVLFRLDYGVLKEESGSRRQAVPEKRIRQSGTGEQETARPRPLIRCSLKRHPEMLKIKALLPMALAFLLLLLMGTLQNCFSREATRFFAERYPMDIVYFTRAQYEAFAHKEWVQLYDYLEAEDGGITAYYLMPEKDSVLHVKGMLACGYFPRKADEVILSQEAADVLFPGIAYEDCVGQPVAFCKRNWTVSAVTVKRNAAFNTNFRVDAYYANSVKDAVFIPYESLQQIADKEAPGKPDGIMAVIEGLGLDPDKQAIVKEALTTREVFGKAQLVIETEGFANVYYSMIGTLQGRINEIMNYFSLVFALIFLLICLYMAAVTRTELFYRRQELGYLQIFGLSKKDVLSMLTGEHVVKVLCAFGVAMALYLVLILFYRLFFGAVVLMPAYAALMCLGAASLYLSFTAAAAVRFLGSNIRKLIA